jgi:hypothetical protein
MIFYGFENWRNGFLVYNVDVFFTLPFDGYEVAVEEGFEVVGDHALFLSERFCEFIYAHGFLHQLFDRCESGGICEVYEESIADCCKSFFQVFRLLFAAA